MQVGMGHPYHIEALIPKAHAKVLFAGHVASLVERLPRGGWGLTPQARTVQHQAPETW